MKFHSIKKKNLDIVILTADIVRGLIFHAEQVTGGYFRGRVAHHRPVGFRSLRRHRCRVRTRGQLRAIGTKLFGGRSGQLSILAGVVSSYVGLLGLPAGSSSSGKEE